ncbi:MAG: LacI family DNA-binding transcriptional regulator [Eubacteriales bacterium]
MATIKDVAREAGVSVSLVSYVMKKSGEINNPKHKKILEIADKLYYVPNKAASSLVTSKAGNIILLVGEGYDEQLKQIFFAEFLYILSETLSRLNIGLTIYYLSQTNIQGARNVILNGTGDGIISYALEVPGQILDIIKTNKIPYISILSTDEGLDYLVNDDYASEYTLLQYLYSLGHRSIAFAGRQITKRWNAYNDFLKNMGLGEAKYIAINESLMYENKVSIDDYLSNNGLDFTAVAALNDMTAAKFMFILQSMGYDVPGQVSVAGFDDMPLAATCNPPLTTVRQDRRSLAEIVINHIVDSIEGKHVNPIRSLVPQELVIRESTRKLDN